VARPRTNPLLYFRDLQTLTTFIAQQRFDAAVSLLAAPHGRSRVFHPSFRQSVRSPVPSMSTPSGRATTSPLWITPLSRQWGIAGQRARRRPNAKKPVRDKEQRMKRTWVTSLLVGVAVSLVALTVTETIHAQSRSPAAVSGRIACVDVVQVFNEFQRQKDLTGEMNDLQTKLQDENKQRRDKIDQLQATIDKLDPDAPEYVDRTREMLAAQIDYKNWVDLKQADLKREIGVWSVKIYKEIVKATEDIAKRDGYDLVLYKGQFETVSNDPEVIKEQIRSIQVLYASPSVEITTVVADKLNADYRAQPRVKMMYVP
jgi:outer membrane protein